MSSRSIRGTQVLVLIFDSKLSVTEHNRTQLFINYDFARAADRFLSIAVNVKRDHGHNNSASMHCYTQGRESVSPILSAEGR